MSVLAFSFLQRESFSLEEIKSGRRERQDLLYALALSFSVDLAPLDQSLMQRLSLGAV